MDAVLQEIEKTEEGYCRDVEKLCSVFVEPLREEQVLSKDEMLAVFSNCETIKGVNEGLLAALQENFGDDPVQHLAAAFIRMAPFLRCYAEYCANFVTANEVLAKIRANNAKVDAAFQRAEMAAKQTVGSMLIKPVQRLCKYPLLFRELCKEVPEDHPAHGEVLQAALEIKDVAARINERVREAEQRALMMALAEAVREPDLVTPSRSLVHASELMVQKLASSKIGSLGAKQPHRLWLCSDVLLLGKPVHKARTPSFGSRRDLGRKASAGGAREDERYMVVERESLELAVLEIISSMSDGQTALRLRCRTSKAEYALWVETVAKADELLRTFAKAVEAYNVAHAPARKAAQTRAVSALSQLQQLNGGETAVERRAAAMEKLRTQRAETADELSRRTESLSLSVRTSSSRTNTLTSSRTKRTESDADSLSGRMDPRAATVSGGSFSTPSFLNELSLESERLGLFGRMRGSLGLGSSRKPSSVDDKHATPSHNLVIELHKKVQTDVIGFELHPIRGGPGVRVHSMHAEGLAHASGVRPADVLLTIDGVPCSSPEAAAEMLRGKGEGATRLELRRDGVAASPAAASPAAASPAAASPAAAGELTPRAAAPVGVDMLGGNMTELSDTLRRRGGPRGSVSFAVPSQAVADAVLDHSGRNSAGARDDHADEQAAAQSPGAKAVAATREAKLRSFAEFCKRDAVGAEEVAEGGAAEVRPRAATSGVTEDMEAWLGAAAEGEGAAAVEGAGTGTVAAEAEAEGGAAAEAEAEGGAAAVAEAEGGSDQSPELIRINSGWQVQGVGTKMDSKQAMAASADQGTKALVAFDELKGVLDALNRRVQLAEADEERMQEALQQRRAGLHTRFHP